MSLQTTIQLSYIGVELQFHIVDTLHLRIEFAALPVLSHRTVLYLHLRNHEHFDQIGQLLERSFLQEQLELLQQLNLKALHFVFYAACRNRAPMSRPKRLPASATAC